MSQVTTVKYDHAISSSQLTTLGWMQPHYATVCYSVDMNTGETKILEISFRPETLAVLIDSIGLRREIQESVCNNAKYVLSEQEGTCDEDKQYEESVEYDQIVSCLN